MRVLLLLCFLFPFTSFAGAQDRLSEVPDPATEAAALRVAPGFAVSLFASEPMLDPPIQMCWDERGRLWVATSNTYPQPLPGQTPNDKIFVLEDQDGDGQADRSTLFADGLHTPTGLLVGDDGIYVANGTEILHLRDTDGDGRADVRRVLLSGFGVDDTHHLIHTFRWGPDGRLYFNQSVYIYSHVETPWGVARLRGGGVWRLDTKTLRLEVFARGLWNPWGLGFDDYGQMFATDGAGFQGIHFIFPDVAYAPAYGTDRVLTGMTPAAPKYAGLTLLGGPAFPDDWQGHLITNDYRANRVVRYALYPEGSGFRAEPEEDLLWTDHVAFRPVDVNQGPDGALYFADWYNPIIQHGEVDFRDPRRDHRHGRIWRVAREGHLPQRPPDLHTLGAAAWLDTLATAAPWALEQARRLLWAEDADTVLSLLAERLQHPTHQGPLDGRLLVEALWLHQAFDRPDPALLTQALQHPEAPVRAAALRVLRTAPAQLPRPEALLAQAMADPDPLVPREALHVLARLGTPEAAQLALTGVERPSDAFLDYARWHTIRTLAADWLPAYAATPAFFDSNFKVTYALLATDAPEATAALAGQYIRGLVPDTLAAATLRALSERAAPEALGDLLTLALEGRSLGSQTPTDHLAALRTAALSERQPLGDLLRIAPLLEAEALDLRAEAYHLVGLWGLAALADPLYATALDEDAPLPLRQAALEALAALDTPETRSFLFTFPDGSSPPPLRLHAIALLPRLDLQQGVQTLLRFLSSAPTDLDPAAGFDAVYRREGGVEALAAALSVPDAPVLPLALVQQGLDQIQTRGERFQTLREAFVYAGAIETVPRMDLNPGFYAFQRLEHDTKAFGNPVRGEAIYRRPALQCQACHAIGGAGGRIGPDLSSIGVTAPMDYLIEALLWPERAVKDGYAQVRVVQRDGTVTTGLLGPSSDAVLRLHDAAGRTIEIPAAQVASRTVLPGSVMPAGLTASLTREEFIDLTAFLAALGDEGPYRVPRQSHVRTWSMRPAAESEPFSGEQLTPADIAAWPRAYSLVNGTMPLKDAQRVRLADEQEGWVVATHLEVEAPGLLSLQLDDPTGVTVWTQGSRVPLDRDTLEMAVQPGLLTLVIQLDAAIRPHRSVALREGPDTTARVQYVQ